MSDRARSAITGEYVTQEFALDNPDTTVVESHRYEKSVFFDFNPGEGLTIRYGDEVLAQVEEEQEMDAAFEAVLALCQAAKIEHHISLAD